MSGEVGLRERLGMNDWAGDVGRCFALCVLLLDGVAWRERHSTGMATKSIRSVVLESTR